MRESLQNIYENMILLEVVGGLNYWLDSNGKLIKVDHHLNYAQKQLRIINWPEYSQGVGWKEYEDALYNTVYKLGYVRVVEKTATIYFTYNRSRPPSKIQADTLFELATAKQKNLVDGETQKTIIYNNQRDPDVVRNADLTKMDDSLKPSYYQKKKDYGETFSKYDLNDYTKIIYEYNLHDEDEVPDYKQNMIDDAVADISKAKELNIQRIPFYTIKSVVEYWTKFLREKGFTNSEIQAIVNLGLGENDDL